MKKQLSENKSSDAAGRNDYLFRQGGGLIRRKWPSEAIYAALAALNEFSGTEQHPNFSDGPLSEREVNSIYKSLKKAKDNPIYNSFENKEFLNPEDALSMLDKEYNVCLFNGKAKALRFVDDEELGCQNIEISSAEDMQKFYSQKVVLEEGGGRKPKIVSAGKYWFENTKKRFKGVYFSPDQSKTRDGYLNLFKGFQYEARSGDWSLLKEHIQENICLGNQEHYQYLISWIARLFQHPQKHGEVALVLKGERGVGKSMLATILGDIVGQHFQHISDSKRLTGSFNAHLMDCLLLFADEALWAGDKAGENVLKSLITEKTLVIEKKGIDPITSRNYLHIVFASNNDWVVPAGADERRFFVLNVGNGKKQDKAYFKALRNQLKQGGYEAFLYDMLNLDISDFEVREVPQTDGLLEQKLESLNVFDKWWFEKLQMGELFEGDDSWTEPCNRKRLYEDYCEFVEHMGLRYKSSMTAFGKFLHKRVPNLQTTHSSSEFGRHRCYVFPSLKVCREEFEKFIGHKIEWE